MRRVHSRHEIQVINMSAVNIASPGTRIRAVYAVCLCAGTLTHAVTLLTCGLLSTYGGVPIFSRAFWTSLTFLDPLSAILLFARPRVGVVLTLLIMLTDVANNTLIWLTFQTPELTFNWINRTAYLCQVAFLIFVLATIKIAWPKRANLFSI